MTIEKSESVSFLISKHPVLGSKHGVLLLSEEDSATLPVANKRIEHISMFLTNRVRTSHINTLGKNLS